MVKSKRFSFNEPHMIGIILSRNQTTNVSHFYGDSRNDNNHTGGWGSMLTSLVANL